MAASSSSSLPPAGDGTSSFSSTSTITPRTARNSAIAGYAAGTTGVVLGHPLDSIKVWVQTNSMGQNKHFATATTGFKTKSQSVSGTSSAKHASTRSSLMTTSNHTTKKRPMSTLIQQQQQQQRSRFTLPSLHKSLQMVRALYSGVSGPLVTVGLVQSINFMTYDTTRRALYYHQTFFFPTSSSTKYQVPQQQAHHPSSSYLDHDPLAHVAIAGFCAGTVLALVTAPLIGIKTHQQVHGTSFPTAARQIWMPRGTISVRQAYVGIVPHLVSETFGRALYYTTYEASKRSYTRYMRETQSPEFVLGWPERMLFAGMAGVACWAAIFPFDALRSRMYYHATSPPATTTPHSIPHPHAVTMRNVARQMWQEGALYRGFGLTALRAGPVAAAVLPVYDYVLEQLSAAD